MCSNNFLYVDRSKLAQILRILFEKALEQPDGYLVDGVEGRYRSFSTIEAAVKGLKKGHTLFVCIGSKYLNINFARMPLDVTCYNRINKPVEAGDILREFIVEDPYYS